MKSSFLTLFLACLISTSVHAQTTKAPEAATAAEGTFDKFYERLKIGYFGAFSGSSVNKWNDLAVDEAGVKDKSYANNLFNQISFNYNFGAKMNFVLNPRWTVNTGRTTGHPEEVNGVLVFEDLLAGFQGTLFTSEDKKFNFWTRIALRLPTSRLSRKNDITYQPDSLSTFTYDFNPKWQFGTFLALRHWVYEHRYTNYRYRIYVSPYIQYTLNDTTKLSLWYENYAENRRNAKSQNDQNHRFQNYWETAMLSVGKDITPKLNFMPFLAYHLNTNFGHKRPLDATGVGFWVSYQIK